MKTFERPFNIFLLAALLGLTILLFLIKDITGDIDGNYWRLSLTKVHL